MKISIIVPVYNAEKYIERCIKSIIKQTYTNIEIIVVNDGSNDSSKESLEKIKDDRIIIINKENTGVSDSRNIGIKKATGDYIMFADADDYLEETAIEKVMQAINNTSADIIKFNYNVINNQQIKVKQEEYKNEILEKDKIIEFIDKLLDRKINAFVWTLAIKKEAIKDTRFNTEIGMMEDLLFFIDILPKINKMYTMNDRLYNYYINVESVSNSSNYYYKNFVDMLNVNELIIKSLKNSNLYTQERKNIIVFSKILGIESIFYKVCAERNVQIEILENMLNNSKLEQLLNENVNLKDIEIQRKINIKLIKGKRKKLLIIFNKNRAKISSYKRRRNAESSNINNK